MTVDNRLYAPAAARNAAAIVAALHPLMPSSGTVLEVASGSGEHGCLFAQTWPQLTFVLSDVDPVARRSIESWQRHSNVTNVAAVLSLDAAQVPWNAPPVAMVLCINMVHIAPWAACVGLMQGSASVLQPGGILTMYGPFYRQGVDTAPSNIAFDAALRAQDAAWGVRDLGDVTLCAQAAGLMHHATVAMPANNLMVVFKAPGP